MGDIGIFAPNAGATVIGLVPTVMKHTFHRVTMAVMITGADVKMNISGHQVARIPHHIVPKFYFDFLTNQQSLFSATNSAHNTRPDISMAVHQCA